MNRRGQILTLGIALSPAIYGDGRGCVDACDLDADGDGDFDGTDCARQDAAVRPGAQGRPNHE